MVFRSSLILAVGAHPDDIELGCGGTLCKAAETGSRIVAVFLTKGELSGDPEIRMRESREALKVLGSKDVFFGPFVDTEIPGSRKSIDFLEQFQDKYKPDVVLTHTVNDVHQDHRQVGWVSITAFRNTPKLLAYETPRVTSHFAPTFFMDVTSCVDSKWKALQCHSSQKQKRYLAYESMVNLASFRGSQANLVAAEAYEVVKYIERL
jgi:LmbE family N-acetylglucosaminyl deacetylase